MFHVFRDLCTTSFRSFQLLLSPSWHQPEKFERKQPWQPWRYVGPYDGTIEVRLETIHQTLLEKHIPSLAFFGYIPAQTRLFRNSHSGFHKGSCHHKTSSAITHTQWFFYHLVNTSSLPHGLHLMLCSNLLLGPTLLPLQRGGCTLSTRLAWQKKTATQLVAQPGWAQLRRCLIIPVRDLLSSFNGIYNNNQIDALPMKSSDILRCECVTFTLPPLPRYASEMEAHSCHSSFVGAQEAYWRQNLAVDFPRNDTENHLNQTSISWGVVNGRVCSNFEKIDGFEMILSQILDGYFAKYFLEFLDDQLLNLKRICHEGLAGVKYEHFFRH